MGLGSKGDNNGSGCLLKVDSPAGARSRVLNGTQLVAVRCRISRGAFSGERVVQIALPLGETYAGVVPVYHCRTEQGAPLERDQPATGQEIAGLVEALWLGRSGALIRVSLPNEGRVEVEPDQVLQRRVREDYVSLGP